MKHEVIKADTARLRSSDRYRMCLEVALTINEVDHRVCVQEVSSSGFSGTSSVRLPVGQTYNVHLPSIGSVAVMVKWSTARTFGCCFVRGLPWRVLLPLIQSAAIAD